MKVWILGTVLVISAACRSTAHDPRLPGEQGGREEGKETIPAPLPPEHKPTEVPTAPETPSKEERASGPAGESSREPITIASNSGIGVNNGSIASSTLYCGVLSATGNGLVLLSWDGQVTHRVILPPATPAVSEETYDQKRACLLTSNPLRNEEGTKVLPTLYPRYVLLTEPGTYYNINIVSFNPFLQSCLANAKALDLLTSPSVVLMNMDSEFTGFRISLRDIDAAEFLAGDCGPGSIVNIKY